MIELITAEQWRDRSDVVDAAAIATLDVTRRVRPLPDHPLVRIRPSGKWTPLDLHEVWAHRELFAILVIRDVTVRYKQTFLGIAWAVFQPLMMMVIYSVIFGRFGGIPSEGDPVLSLRVRGTVALDIRLELGPIERQQSGQQRASRDQGLFPPGPDSRRFGGNGSGRLRHRLPCPPGFDGSPRHRLERANADVSGAGDPHHHLDARDRAYGWRR